MDTILSPDERRILGLAESADTAVLAWSAKEAAAKAVGTGIQGRPLDFSLIGCDLGTGRLQVQFRDRLIEAQVRRISDAICAMAYTPNLGDAPVL